jgi:hypothetical protein
VSQGIQALIDLARDGGPRLVLATIPFDLVQVKSTDKSGFLLVFY